MEELFHKYFAIVFPFMWITISFLLSRMSGWSALSNRYRAKDKVEGKRWWFKSASMNKSTYYGGVLMLLTNQAGLGLSVLLPFRIGHPPLFIPWGDIEINEEKKFFRRLSHFTIRGSGVTISFDKKLGDKLKNEGIV